MMCKSTQVTAKPARWSHTFWRVLATFLFQRQQICVIIWSAAVPIIAFYAIQPLFAAHACCPFPQPSENQSEAVICSNDDEPQLQSTNSPEEKITLLFTGQMVPGRCVQAGVDAKGNADYIYSAIKDKVTQADLAITTINGSLTNACPPMGCVTWTFILNGSPIHAQALAHAGFDGVSVATNHINNCSLTNQAHRPLFDTLDYLNEAGVIPIGAGKNLKEALQPVVFSVKGVRFAIVSLGEIEKNAFAAENMPGIAVLNEENLAYAINLARQRGDVVIFMPHWGPEYSPYPNPNQRKYAKLAVKLGADLIIGNHTHVIQGYETIDGVPVFYGLGNFVFDQFWNINLRSSLLLNVTFEGKKLKGYTTEVILSARDGTLSYPTEEERTLILDQIEKVNQTLAKQTLYNTR